MSNNGNGPTKAQLMEQHFNDQELIGDIIENHSEFAGDVNGVVSEASMAVSHALKLAEGLGDGTGACGSCLADDLRSIVYALRVADISLAVADDMTAQRDYEYTESGPVERPMPEALPETLPHGEPLPAGATVRVGDDMAEAIKKTSDEGLRSMQRQYFDEPVLVAHIQGELERRAGLRQ